MFEKLDVSPKNCRDCNRWMGRKDIGICGVENRKIITRADDVGCKDQMSVKIIRMSYRYPELQPRIIEVAKEIEMREVQQLIAKFENIL